MSKKFLYEKVGFSEYHIFIPEFKKGELLIEIKEHIHEEAGEKKRNVLIELSQPEAIFRTSISIPVKDLRRLLEAAGDFLNGYTLQ